MGTQVRKEAACDNAACTCDELTVPCPSCCTGPHKPSPQPPRPPAPPPKTKCRVQNYMGCFKVGVGAAILPSAQEQLHDRVTLEDCAAACHAAELDVAGVRGGDHCACGTMSDVSTPRSTAAARPQSECLLASCSMKYGDKCSCTGNSTEKCGAEGRMLVYNYSCVLAV
jgi:hypothetical protein